MSDQDDIIHVSIESNGVSSVGEKQSSVVSEENAIVNVSVESDNFAVVSDSEIHIVTVGEQGPRGPQGEPGPPGGITDHGNLTGLSDDDHSQYALADGSRGNFASASHVHDTSDIAYDDALTVGSPIEITSVQDSINLQWSSGIISGCDISDNGNGTVSIASGEASIRASSDSHSDIYIVSVPAQANIPLTDDSTNYVYIDWNGGSPRFNVGLSMSSFNCVDKCIAYMIHRYGTLLHIIDAREQNVDSNRKIRRMFMEYSKFIPAEGGSRIGSSGLNLTVSAGKFFFMIHEQPHSAFDTSIAGTGYQNVFDLWYRNGSGGWTRTTSQKSVSTTTYDSGTGTPATLGNNKYGVSWAYIVHDSPSTLEVVMGQQEYANVSDAIASSQPASLPSLISGVGSLIGKVVYQKSASSFSNVISYLEHTASGAAITNHNSLSGIQGGDLNDYQHLTTTQLSNLGTLTGGGDTTLHSHDSSYDPIGAGASAVASHEMALDPHPQYATDSDLSAHAGSTSNPHSVNSTQVGLGNVENKTFAVGVADATHAAVAKPVPVDADELPISDSASLWAIKKITWASIKSTLKSYFDSLYAAVAHTHTGVYEPANANIQSHISNTSNPHSVTASQLSDFSEAVDDRVSSLLVAGSNVTLTYNDATNTLTVASTGGGSSDHGALTGLADDDHTQYHTDARGDARYSQLAHTHTASNISDFSEAVDDRVSSLLVAGSNVTLTYDDIANTMTIASTGGGYTYAVLGSDYTNSTVSYTDVTGLSASMDAGVYEISGNFIWTSAATTTGMAITASFPSGTNALHTYVQNSSTSANIGFINDGTLGGGLSTGSVSGSNYARIEGIVVVSSSGTFRIRSRSEVDASLITIKAGSFIKFKKIA